MPEPITPVETTPEVAQRNVRLAVGLLGLAILIAAGSIVVALIYLHYDCATAKGIPGQSRSGPR